ncbi:NAD kinase [Xylanibacillus composti]|uniref:NAD kinase n=1 Tax=Xylanibacillus composti TaxID=1572762 RepID=A0A8J4H4J7_9BACL|nr:NAD kinase [Xylanibacillus composti]MDT9723544.1 NAD kinase [Xylanibacillus composti]GIQ68418.1 NAD kinase 1 [Xylanibacillus composti]
MKYEVINRGDRVSAELANTFHRLAADEQLAHDPAEPDIVVSIGGDGTLLHAFHQYVHRIEQTAFVGIHTGHLGFYADWKPEELEDLVRCMGRESALDEKIVKYPLAKVQITNESETQSFLALNECTLRGFESTLVAQLRVNDEDFEMFRGDGICISTPSGSTAYNKSLNGALIHPSLETIQIAEIASINNRVYRTLGSSMVLPRHHHCDIYPRAGRNIVLTIDHLNVDIGNFRSIRCQVAESKVRFVRYRPFPFWNRVKEAFIGDLLD